MQFDWHHPTQVIFGTGTLARLPEAVDRLGAKRVLLVVGSTAMAGVGVLGRVKDLLAGREIKVHEGVRVNLPLEDCDALLKSAREFGADAVVGLGGGSVLDGAKAAAFFAPKPGAIADYLEGRPLAGGNGLPYIAIPTTAGTGSEVTPAVIILDPQKKRKLSFGDRAALARVAIVDPELCLSLPANQTAATGLDALSHAFEAYWSKLACPWSDALALESISVILGALETAYREPANLEARTLMSYGALTAGFALAHTATAAVHGLTYPLTAHYGVPHGLACAFLLREVFNVNFYHLDRGKQVRLLHHLKSNTLGAALELLTELYQALGVPETLSDLGVPEHAIPRLADEATPIHLTRNIAPLSREKILELWAQKKEP